MDGLGTGRRELFRVMGMSYVMLRVMVTWVYTFVKIHVHSERVDLSYANCISIKRI